MSVSLNIVKTGINFKSLWGIIKHIKVFLKCLYFNTLSPKIQSPLKPLIILKNRGMGGNLFSLVIFLVWRVSATIIKDQKWEVILCRGTKLQESRWTVKCPVESKLETMKKSSLYRGGSSGLRQDNDRRQWLLTPGPVSQGASRKWVPMSTGAGLTHLLTSVTYMRSDMASVSLLQHT